MNARPSAIFAVLVGALALPGISSASSVWHPVNSEAGYSYHPDHATTGTSRADVVRELEGSQADGSWYYLQRAEADGSLVYLRRISPQPGAVVGGRSESTGQQSLNVSPEEQRRLEDLYRPG